MSVACMQVYYANTQSSFFAHKSVLCCGCSYKSASPSSTLNWSRRLQSVRSLLSSNYNQHVSDFWCVELAWIVNEIEINVIARVGCLVTTDIAACACHLRRQINGPYRSTERHGGRFSLIFWS